jgi:hypothetical protein
MRAGIAIPSKAEPIVGDSAGGRFSSIARAYGQRGEPIRISADAA